MLVGSGAARSNPKKSGFNGMEPSATGFQEYSRWERPTTSSGLVPKLLINTRKRDTHTSIWMNKGPRQPMGLTPASFHMDCIARLRSRGSLIPCTSRILGCIADMARICLICLMCSGNVTTRTRMVKVIMANPKLLPKMVYNNTTMFSIGLISTLSKKKPTDRYLSFVEIFHASRHSPRSIPRTVLSSTPTNTVPPRLLNGAFIRPSRS